MKPLLAILLFVAVAARGEFRIWEDAKGNVMEGEFVALNGGRVVLRDRADKEYTFSPDDLSKADRQYLDQVVPPKLGIDVSKVTDSGGGAIEYVRCAVSIRQIDRRSYPGKLTAVLVVMGADIRTGASSPAGSKTITFKLPETRGEPIEFTSDRQMFSRKTRRKGQEYEGYVIVVWDRFGHAIAKKSNRDSFEERAEKLAPLEPKFRRKEK